MPDPEYHEYQWSDDARPPNPDAEAAGRLHAFLDEADRHFAIHHAGASLTPAQHFNGVLQFAACTIDTLAGHEAQGDAEDHLGTLFLALGAFYHLLAAFAPAPLPWPERPPGAEDVR